MQASIKGEDSAGCGVAVIDNEGTEHWIEIKYDDGISYHEQDGYPDHPDDRTDEQEQHVLQAQRFARYWVSRQRGYDTVPASENPVRIDAVRRAVADMDTETFEDHFGDLYRQLQAETGTGDAVIDPPPEATDPPIYCQNVSLGVDPLETDLGEQLATELGLAADSAPANVTELSTDEIDRWQTFSMEFAAEAADGDLDLDGAFYVDSTSELYVKYPAGTDLVAADDHLEVSAREPDTVIELLPIELESPEYFQSFMDHYLRCQIRDCFVRMGVAPPEQYHVLGMGQFLAAHSYNYVDFYPEFHNPDSGAFASADII